MLHSVKIKDGKVTFNNKYVRTELFEAEEKYGYPLFIKVKYNKIEAKWWKVTFIELKLWLSMKVLMLLLSVWIKNILI